MGARESPLIDFHQWIPTKIAKHYVYFASKLQLCKLSLGLVMIIKTSSEKNGSHYNLN